MPNTRLIKIVSRDNALHSKIWQSKLSETDKECKKFNTEKKDGVTKKSQKKNKKILNRQLMSMKKKAKKEGFVKKLISAGKENQITDPVPLPIRNSDEPIIPKVKWTNRQKLLVFSSRGLTSKSKRFMKDLHRLLPHSILEQSKDSDRVYEIMTEVTQLKKCQKCIYFVSKKRLDLYMWIANVVHGPSIKFLVETYQGMNDLRLIGNCLVGTRPLLSFDSNFNEPHYEVMKEILTQIFNVPYGFPKSQPFFDRVFVFSLVRNKIYFRNFQIVEEDGQLTEIGPRFCLNPIKIFEGSFSGKVLWSNPLYKSPNADRASMREVRIVNSLNKLGQQQRKNIRTKKIPIEFTDDPTSKYFDTKPPEEAEGSEKLIFCRKEQIPKKVPPPSVNSDL